MNVLRWRPLQISLLIFVLSASFPAFAKKDKENGKTKGQVASFETLDYDNVKYNWTGAQRIVPIGDLHGDFGVLEQNLTDAQLIDQEGNWIGGQDVFVDFLGDYIDGGTDGAMIYAYLRILQAQAEAAGSFVQVPPGNHDILAQSGQDPHVTQQELAEFDKEFGDPEHVHMKLDETIQDVMRDSPGLATWITKQNAINIVKLQNGPRFAFVHGGLNPREIPASPGIIGRINATVRAWQKYRFFGGERPSRKTSGIVGMYKDGTFAHGIGPFFSRINKWEETKLGAASDDKIVDDTPTKEEMNAYLDALGIDILIVGHAPTKNSQIGPHPRWGKRVWVVDIAQSRGFGDKGNVGYLDIRRVPSVENPSKFTFKMLTRELPRVENPNPALYQKIKAMSESDVQNAIAAARTAGCLNPVGRI